eukprot:scaffold2639_cov361-Pavlova_lutheri.AAC.15
MAPQALHNAPHNPIRPGTGIQHPTNGPQAVVCTRTTATPLSNVSDLHLNFPNHGPPRSQEVYPRIKRKGEEERTEGRRVKQS